MRHFCPKCGKEHYAKRRKCETCKSREWIEKNPIIYAYHMLKKSAKKRGIIFTISKDYFCNFIQGTSYMKEKGRLMSQMSIDRIDNEKGYEPGNLQVISKAENINKY